jgi:hypothetical protein
MKNIYIPLSATLLFVVFFSWSGFSQTNGGSPWHFSIFAKGNLSTKDWSADFDKDLFNQYPEFRYKPGYGFSADATYTFSKKWYVSTAVEFAKRQTAYTTGGVVAFINNEGQWTYAKCDAIDQKILQLLVPVGIGYRLFSFLSIEIAPYVQFGVSQEKYRICKAVDWTKSIHSSQNADFGFSPSLLFTLKKWQAKFSYALGLGNPDSMTLTDAVGAEIGTYGLKYRMFTLGVGYQIW